MAPEANASTVLIVDDNVATRYAMTRVLERHGYRVVEAGTGEQGLRYIAEQPVDVLLLDINLPDVSGFDLARDLREAPATALLPIVHVSAAAVQSRDAITGLEAGADAYLTHPVDPGMLLATVRTLLRVRTAEDALRETQLRTHAERLDTAETQLAEEKSARERTEQQLAQAQKMDALGQLSGGIAHDFNNLLTAIITSLVLLRDEMDGARSEGARRHADIALEAARRAASLTHRLLAFARQQPLDARAVNVNARVQSLEDLLRRTIGESVVLEFDLAPDAPIAKVDAGELENAILNLVLNARDALPEGGRVRIGTRTVAQHATEAIAANDYVEVSIADNGLGIPSHLLGKVFDPFFTTKPIGQGTGLGLSMTYGFARQSGGDARIESAPGTGTTVRLLLPVADVGDVAELVASDQIPLGGQGECILLVEDSEAVRTTTATLLSLFGYRCMQAGDVETALAILSSQQPIDLLLTDVGLPGMNGRQLADAARGWRPQLPVLFLTGYTRHSLAIGEFLGEGMSLLTKPYEVEELLATVARMLRREATSPA